MPWYGFLLQFLAGALLANGVPHFVHGVSGSPFQSPFGKPPGVGESSPVSNVLWGFANFVVGAMLLHHFMPLTGWGWAVPGAGALALSIQLSLTFGKVRIRTS